MVIIDSGAHNKLSTKRSSNIHFSPSQPSPAFDNSSPEPESTVGSMSSRSQEPHTILIRKSETGFGFNVRGQVGEGGPMKSINGELYAPLQHVSAVLEDGAAERAGLHKGDRILEVNGISVEGVTHKQVVDLIRSGGHTLSLTVISVTQEDAERLEPQEESTNLTVDYTERRSLPISIPEYKTIQNPRTGEKFTVFCIHMAGRHLCSRRYKQFDELQNSLKREFQDFTFPKFPAKWPFSLSEQQTDSRRRKLEQWLERICSVRAIADSEIVQDFLNSADTLSNSDSLSDVEIKILLPDKLTITLNIDKQLHTPVVYKMCAERISFPKDLLPYFALFELVEYSFERKLRDDERPHDIYIHNYTTATNTCITFGRWLFSPRRELELTKRYDIIARYFFHQAVDEVNRGHIQAGNCLHELKALQDDSRRSEYLQMCRTLPGYAQCSFPPCPSDARKPRQLLVIPIVAFAQFKLSACTAEGVPEGQVIQFDWGDISGWSVRRADEEETSSFSFDYARPEKSVRTVKIFTLFPTFLKECFDRVKAEREDDEITLS
ncbi:hypothetical protein RvY_05989 [Ramazzottius varieornatus]|uniref:PDZ domain-containing protein n=1 Tax=Ramazzottius varieornatus TaxID=947166 RepID=A0A1D1UX08_RAMVA|nr:hypothetical protein RvY_05989 [Ramazzottius varieornatus]